MREPTLLDFLTCPILAYYQLNPLGRSSYSHIGITPRGFRMKKLSPNAYLRRKPTDDIELLHELAEIETAIEECEARKGLAMVWCGQNSAGYYAPQIFTSIGYTGNKNSLLASGVYGVVKHGMGWGRLMIAIAGIYPFSLVYGSSPMGLCFGYLPYQDKASSFSCFQCFAVVMELRRLSLDAFNRTASLDSKFFKMFATVNIGAMGTFSLIVPDTQGRLLEEMDIIFGSVSAEKRSADVAKFEHVLDKWPRDWPNEKQ
ncbi:MAG: hypothetical protein NXY57DRAFT_976381 [Lentinula lateritia]|nr:MAG: hypothetical protein NXY57DRAFT_976381 [Lentinula lateritia]